MLKGPSPGLMKFDTPSTSASSYIKIPVVWGNQFPNPSRCIIAVYAVYEEISYFSLVKRLSGVRLLLESLWSDGIVMTQETSSFVEQFLQKCDQLQISRHPKEEEKEIIQTFTTDGRIKEIRTQTDVPWLHVIFPTNKFIPITGLHPPPDLPFRVFEYLSDYKIIECFEKIEDVDNYFIFKLLYFQISKYFEDQKKKK